MKKKTILHLIPNAHLDPVWLWNFQEGLNEGIRTCRTILDLMDEFPELTFSRGEAAIYRHIEKHDPATFARIADFVRAGRWEVIGGTEVQSDTNLPATETFARHFLHGLSYFAESLGSRPRVAWAADSFGHAAGLPEVMAAAGMTGFAFTRPFPGDFPIAKPAFWWEGPGGSRILSYRPETGWYGTERDEGCRRLDAVLESAARHDLQNVGVFIGLGDHGGGPTRRQLLDIRAWAEGHPEVTVVYSGLHKLLDALRREVLRNSPDFLPVVKGELNFCLRGCYSSVAKFKFLYRKTENALLAAERADAVVRAGLGLNPGDDVNPRVPWNAVLFNTFHDILPGTSIERAVDEQIAWIGGALHQTKLIETAAMEALSAAVDTTVPKPSGDRPEAVPFVLWNPHPWLYRGHVELEANMDYRPIPQALTPNGVLPTEVRGPNGRLVPFQRLATECNLAWGNVWRQRVTVPVEIPAMGWAVYRYGWVDGGVSPEVSAEVSSNGVDTIANARFTVKAVVGDAGVQILRDGRPMLGPGGLTAIVVKDLHGSWGGPEKVEAAGLGDVLETWKVVDVRVAESGTEAAALHVRLAGARSRVDLRFELRRGEDVLHAKARVLWNETAARLKLVLPAGGRSAEFDVPGGTVLRKPCGEVPGGRWVRVLGRGGKPVLGFASDALYNFEHTVDGALRATVARASKYAYSPSATPQTGFDTEPAVDSGELKFQFLLTDGGPGLDRLSLELEQPPTVFISRVSAGTLPRSGSFASLRPASLQLLALKPAFDGDGLVVRVRETSGRTAKAVLDWLGERLSLGTVPGKRIATFMLRKTRSGWKAAPTDIAEV